MTQASKSSKREKCSAFFFAAILSLGNQVLAQEIPGTSPEPHPFEIWGGPGDGRTFNSDDEYAEYCNAMVSHVTGPYALYAHASPGAPGELREVYALAGCKKKGVVSEYQLQKHREAEQAVRQSIVDQVSCSSLKSDLAAYDNSLWLEEHYDILRNCKINSEQVEAYRELEGTYPGWTEEPVHPGIIFSTLDIIPDQYLTEEESDFWFLHSDGEMRGPVWKGRLEQLNNHCNRPMESSEPAFSYPIEREPWFRDIPKPANCRL